MNPEHLNPAEKTVAEADYEKKFNQKTQAQTKELRNQEVTPDTEWKKATKSDVDSPQKRGRFRFAGKRAGKLRKGSAFLFILGLLGIGVWYTSFFAPNILLVNVKEMYTNDLADATTALEIYTQLMYFNKIGPTSGQDCNGGQSMSSQSIKCKLTTMSRSQVETFKRQGFSFGVPIPEEIRKMIPGSDALDVCAQKVYEDNRDDGDPRNDKPESRYKVYCILPPNLTQNIKSAISSAGGTLSTITTGDLQDVPSSLRNGIQEASNQLLSPLKSAMRDPQAMVNEILDKQVIFSGPQLWLYSQLSTTTKEQVYSVFNPKSSFFADARFKQRISTRYNMTKSVTVSGETAQQVNSSFDNAVQKADDGLNPLTGQVNPTNGVSLASLSSPLNLAQLKSLANQLTGGVSIDTVKNIANQLPAVADLQVAGNLLATKTFSYTDLICSWYTIGEMSSNALTRAKASTAARYALQYLKAADSIKAGTAQEVPTNVLASKLAQNMTGGYEAVNVNGARLDGSATDSLIYKSITYGDSIPKSIGSLVSDLEDAVLIALYSISTSKTDLGLAGSWAQVLPNAAALGAVTGASGFLLPPSTDMTGSARQYCQSGETAENQTTIKGTSTDDTKCPEAILALAPLGMQAAVSEIAELGRRSCPPTNLNDDNLIQFYLGTWRGPVHNTLLPSQKAAQLILTPYVAGWFGINTMVLAATDQQLYTSQVRGLAANYALFSGMGELLGDMAMSRGLMPSNFADMELYLHLGEIIGGQKNQDDIARAQAKKNPFDPYNKFSFVGSIVNNMPAVNNSDAPLFATLSNVLSLVGNSTQRILKASSTHAFYHSQPSLITTDMGETLEREAAYAARLSSAACPIELQYIAIGITPDIMCNVRYSMPPEDIATAVNLSGVIDYMTQAHPDMYQSKIDELNQRIPKADTQGTQEYLQLQLNAATSVQNKPFIDKNTGKPTPGSEYDKYLQYCVNRLDPWGRSAVGQLYKGLSDDEKAKREAKRGPNGEIISKNDLGDPNELSASGDATMAAISAQSDQDWYTGKKCTRLTDQSQMLSYFRAYTTLCSVDGSMSGIVDCTEPDRAEGSYSDPFYLNNDILYTSWY